MQEEYDVVVVGGGPGGVCAAVGAAQEGASVLLIERYGFLGGMATAGLVNPFMPYTIAGQRLTADVSNELLERLQAVGALAEGEEIFDDEGLKIVLDQMMADHGVDLLLHSTFVGVEMTGRHISRVQTVGKSGRIDPCGAIFVDATGDGDLAAQAGAPVEIGRAQDGLCQPMTLCFRVGGVSGEPSVGQLRRELTELYLEAKAAGNTLDMTAAELEGRRQTAELLDLFRRRSPRFKQAYLVKMAAQIDVRESRRVMGAYAWAAREGITPRQVDGIKLKARVLGESGALP